MLHEALGPARTILNLGAGTGSYEPVDRSVVAVEPSQVMLAQRSTEAAPSVCGQAGELPIRSGVFDAAMAVLTIHHWDGSAEAGLSEMRRVAAGPIAIVTFDPVVSNQMWLPSTYLPEAAALDASTFPSIWQLCEWLGGRTTVTPIPTSRHTPDWTFASFWAHPERMLDPVARSNTSAIARQPPEVIERAVSQIRADLADGTWDLRYGHLREAEDYDTGMRLVVAVP
jgi:SAM-dependent methyltransferase